MPMPGISAYWSLYMYTCASYTNSCICHTSACSGNEIAAVFRTLPTRKAMPEYYAVVSNPVDIDTVRKYVCVGFVCLCG